MSKFFLRILNIAVFFYLIIQTNSYAGATFVGSTELRESRSATGITFNPDGTKMYILSSQAKNNSPKINNSSYDKLVEYDLSSPFSLVDAEASSAATEEDIREDCGGVNSLMNPTDLHWNEDGTLLFITEATNNGEPNVCQVDINTAYDITELAQHSDPGFNMNDGSATDVSAVGNSAQGIDFSNDGLKLFIVGINDDKVFEFSLSSKFNLTGAEYTGNFFDTSSAVSEPAAMRFSKDGKQLFINDATDDKIVQWSLSSAFDLTSTITLRGSFSIRADYQSVASNSKTAILEGLEFNNDGSKFFITTGQRNNDANSHFALEYKLDCPYGIVRCDPLNDKALMGVIEAQMELSKSVIKYSTLTSLHRIEWIRRNKKNDNLTNQNIKFHFSNKMLESLSKAIPASLKKKSDETTSSNDWHLWSEGDISFGKAGAGLFSLEKRIDTKGITIGADKINEKKNVTGFSLRFGDDHVKVGSSKAYLDQNSYSFMFYNSINQNENKYVDSVIGISTLNIDQKRYFNSWNQGQRNGKQFFGTVKLANSNEKKQFYEKYVKITFGLTKLSEFTETGTDAQIRFEKQTIHNLMTSSGLRLQNINEFQNSTLKIFGLFEHMLDLSPSNSIRLTYNDGSSHNLNFGPSSVQNIKGGLGIDLTTGSGLSVVLNYARDQSIMNDSLNSGHSDDISIAIGYVPVNGTNLVLTSNEKGNALANLNIVKNINGYDIYLNSDYDLFLDERDLYIGINKIF